MNKKIIVLSTFIFISYLVSAQVKWFPDFESTLLNARQTGRSVVVECYHPDCIHCQELNRSLETEYLYTFLNNSHSNFKINLADQKQVEFLDKKNIRLTNFPMFLFFDDQGNFINFIEPGNTPETIKKQFEEIIGYTCVECENTPNPTLKDLVKCAQYYRLSKNTEKNNLVINKLFEAMPETDKSTQVSWGLFKKLVMSTDNELFKYWFNHKEGVYQYEKEGREMDPFAAVIQSQSKILLDRPEKIRIEDLESLRQNLSLLTTDPKRQLTWLWEIEIIYRIQQNDYQGVKEICERMYSYYPNATSYSFLLSKILEKSDDNGMYFYFAEVKDKWLQGLQNTDHIKNYHQIAAKYYGINGEKNQCQASVEQAIKLGLPAQEGAKLSETYCK